MTKFLQTKTEIKAWLDLYGVEKYSIVKGVSQPFVVNVLGDVNLKAKELTSIPVKFNKVQGSFDVSDNSLTSLAFCPKVIKDDFLCSGNLLKILDSFPLSIGARISLAHNQLQSLKGLNIKKVNGSLNCSYNALQSLKGSPETILYNFDVSNNQLLNLVSGPKYVGKTYRCNHNRLTSLKGSPRLIAGFFTCANNNLETLQYCPEEIVGDFYFECNKINTLAFFPVRTSRDIFCTGNPSLKFMEQMFTFDKYFPIHQEHLKILQEAQELEKALPMLSTNLVRHKI